MKLYFSPGACSLSAHIVLREAGFDFDTEKVNLADKKTASGGDYRAINPKGYVPALQLDDGQILTEAAVVLQYLADRKPETGLAPAAGTMERYRLMEMLNFISSEFHKTFGPLFHSSSPQETKQGARDTLTNRLKIVEPILQKQEFLMGSRFTVADAYLFTVLSWTRLVKFDLGPWPAVQAYLGRVAERPAVQAAMREEGLIKS
ncbi:glutathione transferase GstA [Noviherbaspirillum galbum]|uniref:Glutathione transferase GstA n=1 Tax=Noviherbaspirillum galbum TaxID=2709383 RepID=A0A6B3SZ87_9BURK|nr:glutathione transferase GstA [Noviherbaspirillum galbum]NEX63799.1 glutathione transferase GstA [Noviherbaspirillum galbum]